MRSDRWSNTGEILEKLEKFTPKSKHGGSILFQHKGSSYLHSQEGHQLILGLSGAGKTRRCILPTIRTYIEKNESFILMDVKGEVYKQTACYAKGKYNVKVIDLRNLDESENWNPFTAIYQLYHSNNPKDRQRAVELLDVLAHSLYPLPPKADPFWIFSARNVFQGCAYILLDLAKPEEINMSSIYELIIKGEEKFAASCYLQEYMEALPEGSPAQKLLHSYLKAPHETKGGMRSVMLENLAIFIKNRGLEAFVSQDTLDINSLDNSEKPLAIYVIVPDETPVYDSLISVLVSQLTSHFINLAEQKYAGKLPNRVNIVLEELGNNSKIPNLDRLLSASRSRNIRIQFVLQSLSQLEDLYEKSKSETIISNTDITMAFRVNDWKTLQELSEKCGRREVDVDGKVTTESLITPSQLAAMETGQALVIISGRTKFITKLPDYEEMFDCTHWEMPERPLKSTLPVTVPVFDIKTSVKEFKRQKMLDSLDRGESKSERNNVKSGKNKKPVITGHPDCENESFIQSLNIDWDAMMRDIDRKIAELEEEEKKRAQKKTDKGEEGEDIA